MALPKPENQPYAIIFRATPPTHKLSVCMENQLDIVCIVHYMMNDTPSTGKSTLCCNISITLQTNKQTNYLFAWKTILRLFVVCVLLRMTLLVLENQPYAIFDDYTTNKRIVLHGKLFIREQAERLCEALMESRRLAPDGGCKGAAPPCLRKKCIW